MRVFGALLTLLSVAFTASAAPTAVTDGNGLTGPVDGLVGKTGGSNGFDPNLTSTPDRRAVDFSAAVVPDLGLDCLETIDGIVAAGVKVDVNVLLPILVEIRDILIEAVVDIRVLVAHPTDVIFTVNGRVPGVVEIAQLVAILIRVVVVGVVQVVVRAVGPACANVNVVLAGVSDQLSIVLFLSFKLVAKLFVTLLPLIRDITRVVLDLRVLASLAVVLRL
ncbi:hypothetical protein APHAL10511_005177 [Amanita phalloides]|nr:hypothetical protein APHAL10511_005177 [Amanita phalloides]